jgi:endonuclease YncB( thermonuclease family)
MVLLTAYKPSKAHVTTHEVRGLIMKVTNIDTVTLPDSCNNRISFRLDGIDSPESRMPYGQARPAHLRDLAIKKVVIATIHKQDCNWRTVATLRLSSEDVNLAMINAGMAQHYKKYEAEQLKHLIAVYDKSEQVGRSE